MKTKLTLRTLALPAMLLSTLIYQPSTSFAQGTAFTYQGRLTDNGSSANGLYDLQFTLYDTPNNLSIVGGPVTNAPVPVTNGLFTVTLDFGGGFDGNLRWLGIAARTNGGGAFTTLVPRQPITATPYAILAGKVSGTVDAVTLGGLSTSNFWQLAGNGGTTAGADFLGTTDSRALELKVNGARALRLEPGVTSPNLIGGYQDNIVLPGTSGAAISGGGRLGLANTVIGDFGAVDGGLENTAGNLAAVGGGQHNQASGLRASVGGGGFNLASGASAAVPGGSFNTAAGTNSFAAGNQAQALHNGSFVWADQTLADFSSTAANQFLIRASGGVGIGTSFPSKALDVRDGSGAGGDGGRIHVGGTGVNGDPKLINFGDGDFVHVGENGADDRMELKAGTFFFTSSSGTLRVGVGTATPVAELDVIGTARVGVLTITGGADVAEPFHMSTQSIPKGALVVIDENHPGQLKLSGRAYDRRVAGVVSGANGIQPGLTLHQEGAVDGGENVALSGRVYALADASNGPIKPGDLLTTSDVPGHAMRVTDHAKAQGAIIGKAMGSLEKGRGMVLVLVSLQ